MGKRAEGKSGREERASGMAGTLTGGWSPSRGKRAAISPADGCLMTLWRQTAVGNRREGPGPKPAIERQAAATVGHVSITKNTVGRPPRTRRSKATAMGHQERCRKRRIAAEAQNVVTLVRGLPATRPPRRHIFIPSTITPRRHLSANATRNNHQKKERRKKRVARGMHPLHLSSACQWP